MRFPQKLPCPNSPIPVDDHLDTNRQEARMSTYSVAQAKAHLSALLDQVARGEADGW